MSRTNQLLLALALLGLAGCGNGKVIGGGASPTGPTITPNVSYEYAIPTAGSGPFALATGIDGNIYFTENTASKVGQLSTGGTFNEIATTTANAGPAGIISGPDGGLWFTESEAGKIGTVKTTSFTTTGLKEYPVTWAPSHPAFISRGPANDTLYFTDPAQNAVGSITTSGVVAGPYAIPSANANPQGLAVGPDNKIWFAENGTGKIGILDPAAPLNPMTEIALSSAAASPQAIVLGPDGAMWFTENQAGSPKLGRITASHTYTEIPLTGAQSATSLAVDVFGDALMITDPAANKIGIYEIAGAKFTEYAATDPTFIGLGPDGRMYFTENANNKIGQFSYF